MYNKLEEKIAFCVVLLFLVIVSLIAYGICSMIDNGSNLSIPTKAKNISFITQETPFSNCALIIPIEED